MCVCVYINIYIYTFINMCIRIDFSLSLSLYTYNCLFLYTVWVTNPDESHTPPLLVLASRTIYTYYFVSYYFVCIRLSS